MNYHAAIEYLESLRHSRPKLGTGTTEHLLGCLGDPHEGVAYVQVAGSNGKGSTARMVESILREAGLDVGLYTSPDLADVRERILVNGRQVQKSSVAALVENLRPHVVERTLAGDGPTAFEVLTVVALAQFGRRDVDVAVLEVGIGGRYDATSVVDPVASAVTSVSLEHTDIIGESVEEIARDKSHVAPADRPLVTGATGEALAAIRERTPVVTVGREDTEVLVGGGDPVSPVEAPVRIEGPDFDVETTIPLLGDYQVVNAGVAATLARQVADVDAPTLARGLRSAHWPGRFEVVETDPLVVLDGAHNPAACDGLAGLLDRVTYGDLHLVFGAMRDKDLPGMRDALGDPASVVVTRPDVGRAEDTTTLAALFEAGGIDRVEAVDPVPAAVETAIDRADPGDCVLVTGSLYTVSEARDRWTGLAVPRSTATVADAREVLDGADVPDDAPGRTPARAVHRTVSVDLRPAQAETVETEMRAAGGECAVAGVGSAAGRVRVVLSGSVHRFERLLASLRDRPGFTRIADRVEAAAGVSADDGGRGRVVPPTGPHPATDDPDGRTSPWDEGPAVMGVLNVTPDSFHDGGEYLAVADAVDRAKTMVENGATIVDVGGESTRPGADPTPVETELDRVLPVVEELADVDATVSVDTRKAAVADATLEAGADMINDVSGLADPEMRFVVADHGVPVVVMHSLGTPVDPDRRASVAYDDPVRTVIEELADRVLLAERAGIDRGDVVVDPGIGFGKAAPDSFELLSRLDEFRALGCPVMVGHSRKSLFGSLGYEGGERLPATVAATAMAVERGADVVRVHDVAENVAAVRTATATRE